MCDLDICDSTTTKDCEEPGDSGAARCTCKEGYITSQFTSLSCRRKYLFLLTVMYAQLQNIQTAPHKFTIVLPSFYSLSRWGNDKW